MWDNFMGSPSAYFVFAVPQDGIAAPADFNASASGYLRKIWDGTATGTGAGTLTGPDASGFYTVTLTGVTIPDNAVMLTGGMGYSYSVTSTLPLTQTNLADYPVTAATVPAGGPETGQQAGRPDRDRAQRAEGRHRLHRPARDRRGRALQRLPPGARHLHRGRVPRRPAQRRHDLLVVPQPGQDQQRLVGGFDGLRPRDPRVGQAHSARTPGTRRSATDGFFDVTYPGILNNCQTCHLPGTFDFSASAVDQRVGPGRRHRPSPVPHGRDGHLHRRRLQHSPYITAGTAYGSDFSFNAGTGCDDRRCGDDPGDVADRVTVCSACHDSADAIAHFKINSGSFYRRAARRSRATNETCLVCHGTGRIADIAVMHSKNR